MSQNHYDSTERAEALSRGLLIVGWIISKLLQWLYRGRVIPIASMEDSDFASNFEKVEEYPEECKMWLEFSGWCGGVLWDIGGDFRARNNIANTYRT